MTGTVTSPCHPQPAGYKGGYAVDKDTEDETMPTHCTGTLLWFDVPADDRFEASAILLCSDCGYVIVSGSLLDARHSDSQVLRAD